MSMGGTPFRPAPKLPPNFYKTYRIASPITTHYRPATCAEIDCKAYKEGWTYKKSDLEKANLLYTVTHAGKRFHEAQLADDAETYLVFEPGQVCFQARTHRISLDRPQFFFAGRGDYRTFSHRNALQFDDPADWVDSFANHQDIIKRVVDEGI